MFSTIMNYFAPGSGNESNNGEDSGGNKEDQQAESPESELEKLKR